MTKSLKGLMLQERERTPLVPSGASWRYHGNFSPVHRGRIAPLGKEGVTMRVAIGGISHESSTFATVQTALEDFEKRMLLEGGNLVDTLSETKTPIGGFIDAARDAAFEVVPTIEASATPGGPVTAEATRDLVGRLVVGLHDALKPGPLDGVLLALHGAMVSELDDDGESYILRAVREVV